MTTGHTPFDPRAKRQHALSSAPLSPQASPNLRPAHNVFITIACVLCLLALLGLAHHLDAQAEADDAAIAQRISDHIDRQRADRAWAHRMAVAYARGQEDALQLAASSPEDTSLQLACNHRSADGLQR